MTIRTLIVVTIMLLFASTLLSIGVVIAEADADASVIDTGYRPWTNGFSFQNFGDPEDFYGVDLGAALGPEFHDEVFRHTGHCYGMSRASVDDFLANRSSVAETPADAMARIDRLQTDQSFYYVAEYLKAPLGGGRPDNRVEYQKIIDRLSSGQPAVLGIYYSGGGHPGHAIVAYRADIRDNETLLSVYDPNLPPAMYDYELLPMTAVYDFEKGTFHYDNGQPFDQVRLNDLNDEGVAHGRALTASLATLPGMALFMLALRRFPPAL